MVDLHLAVSVAVMVIGLVLYLVNWRPPTTKPGEVGRLAFFAGLLVALLQFAGLFVSVHLH